MRQPRTHPASELGAGETTLPLSGEGADDVPRRFSIDFVHPREFRSPLLDGVHILGRDQSWPHQLSSDAVSRRHAQVAVRANALSIADLRSRNGVHVNGVRCSQQRLTAGDVVRLGDHVGIVRELAEAEFTEFSELVPGLWGRETLRRSVAMALTAASARSPLLIQGETGTGKELMARTVHERSKRSGRWVPVNCAALNPNLLEAELFGHAKGAFTGADAKRSGLVRSAEGGTLFLDELGELPLVAQAKLLRVVQFGEVLPVGAEQPTHADVRFIAATHRNLDDLVKQGAFRADLYHRVAGLPVTLPALRQRKEDIVPLFCRFVQGELGRLPALAPLLVEALCLYAWPGNVRELRQVAGTMCLLHASLERWRHAQLPPEIGTRLDDAVETPPPELQVRPSELDEAMIRTALADQRGNVSRAAKALGVSRQSLYDLVRKFEIDADTFRVARG